MNKNKKKFKSLDSNFWKKYLRIYDTLNQSISYRQLIKSVTDSVNVKFGDYILEAGIGTGNLAMLLEKEGAKVVGVDFSEEALSLCNKKCPNIETIKVDLQNEKLPFEDDLFDKVVSNNVLYNIPKEKRLNTILELKRVLKPGGVIVLSNLHRGFKPLKVYLDTVSKNIKKEGFWRAIFISIKLIIPVAKIFYYNFKIQSRYQFQKDNLFDIDEQNSLLNDAGFENITDTKFVYARQGILNSAKKSL